MHACRLQHSCLTAHTRRLRSVFKHSTPIREEGAEETGAGGGTAAVWQVWEGGQVLGAGEGRDRVGFWEGGMWGGLP